MNTRIRTTLGLAAATLTALGLAAGTADRNIDAGTAPQALAEQWNVSSAARIEIANVRGKVSISGWDRDAVALGGELGAGSTLAVSAEPARIALRVKATHTGLFGGDGPPSDSTLVLHVPRDAQLDVHVVSADAHIDGVAGAALAVGSVSGDVTIASGAPQVDIDSVSGDVRLAASASGADMRVHVQTVSGNVQAIQSAGRLKLETVSGTLDCTCNTVRELDVGSVSGDARIDSDAIAQARLALESMSGDIRLRLPADLSAQLHASTFSGAIRSAFGAVQEKSRGPGASLDATVGAGAAQIRVQAFSGDVQFDKR